MRSCLYKTVVKSWPNHLVGTKQMLLEKETAVVNKKRRKWQTTIPVQQKTDKILITGPRSPNATSDNTDCVIHP